MEEHTVIETSGLTKLVNLIESIKVVILFENKQLPAEIPEIF